MVIIKFIVISSVAYFRPGTVIFLSDYENLITADDSKQQNQIIIQFNRVGTAQNWTNQKVDEKHEGSNISGIFRPLFESFH